LPIRAVFTRLIALLEYFERHRDARCRSWRVDAPIFVEDKFNAVRTPVLWA